MISAFLYLFVTLIASFLIKYVIEALIKDKSLLLGIPQEKFLRYYQYAQGVLSLLILFMHGLISIGLLNTCIYLVYSISIGVIAEVIFLKTHCLGRFHYTNKIKPKLFGILPFYIPVMWSILSYIGVWTAFTLLEDPTSGFLLFLLSPMLITLIDLLGDPIAVDDQLWLWQDKGHYSGIPAMNYVGWYITAGVISTPLIVMIMATDPGMIPSWILYTPTMGYVFYFLILIKICFEKRLVLARNTGIVIVALLIIWLSFRFSSLI